MGYMIASLSVSFLLQAAYTVAAMRAMRHYKKCWKQLEACLSKLSESDHEKPWDTLRIVLSALDVATEDNQSRISAAELEESTGLPKEECYWALRRLRQIGIIQK